MPEIERLREAAGNAHLEYCVQLIDHKLFPEELARRASRMVRILYQQHKIVGDTLCVSADGDLWWNLDRRKMSAMWALDPETSQFEGHVNHDNYYNERDFIEAVAQKWKESHEQT
jgi:hypothetical protein